MSAKNALKKLERCKFYASGEHRIDQFSAWEFVSHYGSEIKRGLELLKTAETQHKGTNQ